MGGNTFGALLLLPNKPIAGSNNPEGIPIFGLKYSARKITCKKTIIQKIKICSTNKVVLIRRLIKTNLKLKQAEDKT